MIAISSVLFHVLGLTLFSSEVLGFLFGFDPLAGLLGDPGGIGPVLAVRLLLEAVDVTDSASEPRLPFDLFFAIESRIGCKYCL